MNKVIIERYDERTSDYTIHKIEEGEDPFEKMKQLALETLEYLGVKEPFVEGEENSILLKNLAEDDDVDEPIYDKHGEEVGKFDGWGIQVYTDDGTYYFDIVDTGLPDTVKEVKIVNKVDLINGMELPRAIAANMLEDTTYKGKKYYEKEDQLTEKIAKALIGVVEYKKLGE